MIGVGTWVVTARGLVSPSAPNASAAASSTAAAIAASPKSDPLPLMGCWIVPVDADISSLLVHPAAGLLWSAVRFVVFDVRILGSYGGPAIGLQPHPRAVHCLKPVLPWCSAPYARCCNARRAGERCFIGAMDTTRPDDAALAARLATDLDGSFESLVHAHQDRLFTIAFRTGGDRHDAEELVQDASSAPTGPWPAIRRRGSASSGCAAG